MFTGDAAVGAGFFRSHADAVAAMTRPGDVFEPEADTSKLYDRLYREVYSNLYGRLAPLYRSIRRITGYPAH